MKDNKDNMNDELELTLRQGMWESIEPEIPIYKSKKRRGFLFLYLGISLLSILLSINYFSSSLKQNSKQISKDNKDLNQTKEIVQEEEIIKKDKSIRTEKLKTKQLDSDLKNLKSELKSDNQGSNQKKLVKETNISKTYESNAKPAKEKIKALSPFITKSIENLPSPLFVSQAMDQETIELEGITLIKKGFYPQKTQPNKKQENGINKTSISSPSSRKNTTYLELSYGMFVARFILLPQLMKLENGKGEGFQLSLGRRLKHFNIYSGLTYQNISQTTVMPGAYSTKYHQAFTPNFKTMLPGEYAYRVHDTNNLAIPGKPNNYINQNFKLFGLQLGVNGYIIDKKRIRLGGGYGIRYQKLQEASTFFWDSINGVAVPFRAKDKNIVFRNILSSQINIDLGYRLNQKMSFHAMPYYEIEHSAIIKHYYKLKIQNYGLNLALRYYFY